MASMIATYASIAGRGRNRVLLARWRRRRGQRLTDRAPVHPMPLG
jgi:hypothetical protein